MERNFNKKKKHIWIAGTTHTLAHCPQQLPLVETNPCHTHKPKKILNIIIPSTILLISVDNKSFFSKGS
jgi:hypothetical protein